MGLNPKCINLNYKNPKFKNPKYKIRNRKSEMKESEINLSEMQYNQEFRFKISRKNHHDIIAT